MESISCILCILNDISCIYYYPSMYNNINCCVNLTNIDKIRSFIGQIGVREGR